jgi:hypothetical protein
MPDRGKDLNARQKRPSDVAGEKHISAKLRRIYFWQFISSVDAMID